MEEEIDFDKADMKTVLEEEIDFEDYDPHVEKLEKKIYTKAVTIPIQNSKMFNTGVEPKKAFMKKFLLEHYSNSGTGSNKYICHHCEKIFLIQQSLNVKKLRRHIIYFHRDKVSKEDIEDLLKVFRNAVIEDIEKKDSEHATDNGTKVTAIEHEKKGNELENDSSQERKNFRIRNRRHLAWSCFEFVENDTSKVICAI